MKCPFFQRENGKKGIDCDDGKGMNCIKCTHVFRSNVRRDRFEMRYCMSISGWQQCPWARFLLQES